MKYRMTPTGSSSLSFRLHNDIKEELKVIYWHRGSLKFSDVLLLNGRMLKLGLRRALVSAVRGHFERFAWAFVAIGRSFVNVVRSLGTFSSTPERKAIEYNGDSETVVSRR
jgi:hypothetical protein